jgi:hypothetical protein
MAERDDDALRALVEDAFVRLDARLSVDAPTLARQLDTWCRGLAGGGRREDYFLDPSGFPILLLPWWFEASTVGRHDLAFGRDLVYASLTGYLVIRLIDDLMDADPTFERSMTPALLVLHTEFLTVLARSFRPADPVWDDIARWSAASAETAAVDARASWIDRITFEQVSARKTIGARIPLSAMASHHGRRDALAPWLAFVDALGRWHQMANDTRDWARDLAAGRPSYVLTTAADRSGAGGSIEGWMIGEGIDWAFDELAGWMGEARSAALGLGSDGLLAWLDGRAAAMAAKRDRLSSDLPALRDLATAMAGGRRGGRDSGPPATDPVGDEAQGQARDHEHHGHRDQDREPLGEPQLAVQEDREGRIPAG